MSENRKIAANVLSFLDEAADSYAKIKADSFSQEMYCDLLETGIESPIEDIFYIACNVWCAHDLVELNPSPFIGKCGPEFSDGVFIEPQKKIGKYRVDFLISKISRNITCQVIVELDGHDFHDKNKTQRAYEKARDRYFVSTGFKVLHFTGSEVVADPFKVAYETLLLIGMFLGRDKEYNKNNPFGVE